MPRETPSLRLGDLVFNEDAEVSSLESMSVLGRPGLCRWDSSSSLGDETPPQVPLRRDTDPLDDGKEERETFSNQKKRRSSLRQAKGQSARELLRSSGESSASHNRRARRQRYSCPNILMFASSAALKKLDLPIYNDPDKPKRFSKEIKRRGASCSAA